jgi:Transposase IS66 family
VSLELVRGSTSSNFALGPCSHGSSATIVTSRRGSTGTVDAVLSCGGDALAEPHQDLLDAVRSSRRHMDETGWRLQGSQRALWGAFTDQHALFKVVADRHQDHARALLADTKAIVISDRWWAYSHLPLSRRQICWAHCGEASPRTPKDSRSRRVRGSRAAHLRAPVLGMGGLPVPRRRELRHHITLLPRRSPENPLSRPESGGRFPRTPCGCARLPSLIGGPYNSSSLSM